MNVSIKNRIYLSFTLLVVLFIVNSIITVVTLNSNKKLSTHISTVIDPSVQALNDFRQLVVEAKMYSTNWVFLRYNQDDKDALIKLHNKDYQKLKNRLNLLSANWDNGDWVDSLNKVYSSFDKLIKIEKVITNSLTKFDDYDNLVVKLEAERVVEDEIIPRTAFVMHSLEKIINHEQDIRIREAEKLNISSSRLRAFIALLSLTFICLGLFLSIYFSRIIINPIEKIKRIVNDLGKGITRIIKHNTKQDEIGEMVSSVNSLSKNLERTATFAKEIGARNFEIPFEPLSNDDTLGKALVAMRDNLKHSDAQLNEAQHIAHLGNWERDLKTDKISWSDEMFSIFEISRASFNYHQQTFLNAVHPDDLDRVKQLSRQNQNDKAHVAYECRIVTLSSIKTIYVEDKVFLNEKGELVKTSGIVQDITERKKSSLALEEALIQLKRLLENIDQAFFVVDMVQQQVLQMSIACEKIYGVPPEVFCEDFSFWMNVVHKDDLHIINDMYVDLNSGLQSDREYRIMHKDGSIRWVEVRIAPTLNEAGKLVRIDGVINDIGKRKTAEIERDRITADLIHRNKDLEQFTYIVSHNLRAPVANIMGLSSLLNISAADNCLNGNKDLLDGVSVSIKNLNDIILDLNQILAIRTPGYEKKEMVSLNLIVSDIKASIKHLIDKENVVIKCDFEEAKNVFVLRSYIYSILYNLILNSIKYKQTEVAPAIEIRSSISNGKTCIFFQDNGKGIDVKKNGKDVFMLYKRFDTSVEGKGIGLYMVKTAVETLGGSISFKSELNIGTQFKVELSNN